MNGDVRAALTRAEEALHHASQHCKYHSNNFGFLGWTGPENVTLPRCDSCKQPWRVMRALEAITKAKEEHHRDIQININTSNDPIQTAREQGYAAGLAARRRGHQ